MTERVSKESYDRLVSNRPFKFDEAEVNYRSGHTGHEQCEGCAHFFQRKADDFGVCEIFRPTRGKEEVRPNFVCDFFTEDGEEHPLLTEPDEE